MLSYKSLNLLYEIKNQETKEIFIKQNNKEPKKVIKIENKKQKVKKRAR